MTGTLSMTRKRKTSLNRSPSPKSFDDDFDCLDSPPAKMICERGGKPLVRNAANARERARMRVLSKAFSRLKTSLPMVPPDTKLSKLDTLRLASNYIAHLMRQLDEDNTAEKTKKIFKNTAITSSAPKTEKKSPKSNSLYPMDMTWPFTFNGKITATLQDSKFSSPRSISSPNSHSDVKPVITST